ncbi:MAG: hypothetical protein ACYS0E_21390, partial [Planctomycetota bacterium]
MALDKWFIPEIEECEVKYGLSGPKECADKVRMDVFASNYCDCRDWNDGAGAYDKGELETEPIYVKEGLEADERKGDTVKWKGECTTEKGMLSVKIKDADKRHVNVAFSPYTVQMTYHKAALPESDRPQIVLKPFWPQWKMKETEPAVAAGAEGGGIAIKWKNDDDVDGAAIEVADARLGGSGAVVFRKSFTPKLKTQKDGDKHTSELERPDPLKKGERSFSWDKSYREGEFNGALVGEFIDDNSAPWDAEKRRKELLFKSTPYKMTVKTLKPELEADSLKVGWKVLNSGGKLKRGFVRIKDRCGRTVWLEPLPEGKMADGEHEVTWDGKYPEGVKNTLGGDEVTPWDMPYRIELEAHTTQGEAEGLALAVMHSEVRLYTHSSTHAHKDPRFDSFEHKASMMLAPGPLMAKAELVGGAELKPGVEPKNQATDEWVRYKLAEAGYHPGPVHKAHDDDFKTSLKEFKRSVPADGNAGAGNFTRLPLDPTNIDLRDGPTRTSIRSLRDGDKRKAYGDPDKVDRNDNSPDLTDDEVKAWVRDPAKDMVIWVDDRQYYTDTDALDETNKPFLKISGGENKTDPAAIPRVALGLDDYRGGMVQADNKTALDEAAIPRPWLPLQVEPRLMGKDDELFAEYDDAKVKVDDDARRKAMRSAVGPLRIDWSFEELPFDVSTIDPADYPAADFNGTPPPSWEPKKQTRTRRFVSWEIWRNKAEHDRRDTGRKEILTNCLATRGGARAPGYAAYVAEMFGAGDQQLWPIKASSEAETVATVTHELIHKDQGLKKLDKPLVADLVGTSCVYFRPSAMGGDGYRVGAAVTFEKTSDYDFPNLDALKKRYPSKPQAHSARMRVWRRSSIRGCAY